MRGFRDGTTRVLDRRTAGDVAFRFKQWSGKNKKKTGRTLDGRTWDHWPKPKRRERRSVRTVMANAM
ncbi:hypothetical protein XH83_27695 [Bradyrhizobium sp. CCBAU 53351]|nr:hypothetical protein XH83_27695 [Bradyrhizobium sp. CCBAU 53351]